MSEKITFILGAGSNFEFGFPLGRQLYNNAIEKLNTPNYGKFFHAVFNIPSITISDFRNSLIMADLPSIDRLVFYHREFETIGKLVIGSELLETENKHRLFNSTKENHWYRSFWNLIRPDRFDELKPQKYAFITFNYDRSLEYYLTHVFYHTFNKIEKMSKAKYLNHLEYVIPILHVYGKLGDLVSADEDNILDYGIERTISESRNKELKAIKIQKAFSGIELIFENREKKQILKDIYQRLSISDLIIFLGFGFDNYNLNNLGVKDIKSEKMGFAKGVSLKRQIMLKKEYGIKCDSEPTNIEDYLKKINIF
jgi:hypothetical protein